MWKLREIIERPPFLVAWKCTNSTKREFKWTLFLTHKESQITNFSDSLAFYVCPCSLHPFLHFPSFKSFSLHYSVLSFFYLFQFFLSLLLIISYFCDQSMPQCCWNTLVPLPSTSSHFHCVEIHKRYKKYGY